MLAIATVTMRLKDETKVFTNVVHFMSTEHVIGVLWRKNKNSAKISQYYPAFGLIESVELTYDNVLIED